MVEVKEYLNTYFPGLCLGASLYNQWDTGIHFELGEGIYQIKDDDTLNLDRFERVYKQSLSIFNFLFSEQDDIFLVTNVYHHKSNKKRMRQTKVYDRFLKNKKLKFNVRQETLPFIFADEEEADGCYTSRFFLKCKKRDLDYLLLIKAICNEDFPLKPKLGGENGSYYPDVFFINASKNIIFFIYDDRGCEVISDQIEALRPLYNEYKNWIAEYNREEVEQTFKQF
ncbi:DUF3885 domain-containing protein [Bacillus suaedae]|uniref:DUF3885 domain-containing protein n=1 Tax=Halalkalibacter suaedae TaxID=2822140 RepID=A0A941ANK7_9BACI|nr:DUF3885 domain-containing protein [Bacillus suaedae]MBP3951745.1 DUF3885 domain-containing protein [Bacillus suaedae]